MSESRPPPEVEGIDLIQLAKMARVNRQVINRLKSRVARLERLLDLLCGDPELQWLYRNRSERMDATVPIFDPDRAEFHLARYRFAAERLSNVHPERIESERPLVADIACGTGYGSALLADEGRAGRVIGIDRCPDTIDYARRRHGGTGLPGDTGPPGDTGLPSDAGPHVEFVVAEAAATGLADGSVDWIVSFETIEHVEDDRALVSEWDRILAAGGQLICSTPNRWPLEIAPHHVREYDRQSFLDVLETRFDVIELFNQNSGTESPFNHGQPAGIVATTDQNAELAECFIAVARKPV